MNGLLLDTHVAVWLSEGTTLSDSVLDSLTSAGLGDGIFVSPITGWEIGLLAVRKKELTFDDDPASWFAKLMAMPNIKPAPFDGQIAISAAYLPGDFHADPADRLLVATARTMDVPLVTRDKKILAYAKAGHVKVLAC